MTRKHLFLILMLIVSLFALGACGDDDGDTGTDRPDFNSSSSSGDVSSTSSSSSGDTTSTSSSGDTTSTSSSGDTTSTSSSGDTTSSGMDMSSGGETCADAPMYLGQVGAPPVPDPSSHHGGMYTATPYDASYDSGLAAVRAELDALPANTFEVTGLALDITEATVSATSYNDRGNRVFWIADGAEKFSVFFPQADAANAPSFTVKVGQKISFQVTDAEMAFGKPTITGVDATVGWTANSEDNPVYVSEHTDGPAFDIANVNQLVRVKGTLTGGGDPCDSPDATNPYRCYDLSYAGGAETVAFRTNSDFVALNDCVTYVGPLGSFSDAAQLFVDNYTFYWTLQPGE